MNNADIALAADRTSFDTTSTFNPIPRFLMLALIAGLLLFPSLRRPGLAGYDDSFFSHEAKEMVRTGDWWNVRLNGEIIFEIPPLFVWLQAASFKLFGISDAAAKLPTVVLGFSTVLLMYFLTLELTGQSWLSLLAMLVLASTQFFLKNATHAMTDVPFTFFFALTIFCYLKGLRNHECLTLLGLPLGCALLTRSVVGFLPLGIILAHLVLTKRYRMLLSPWLICGVLLTLALSAVWYVSQYRQHGFSYFAGHLQFLSGKMHVETESSSRTSLLNYPMSLLKYYWPWLPFLVAGMVIEIKAWMREKDQTAALLIIWTLLVLVPFSFVETRYPRYIMAVFPAFSILSAIALNRVIPIHLRSNFFRVACGVGCLAICLSLLFPPKSRAEDILKLAPIAEANSSADERVLFYTFEDGREDYLFQFIWYSHRYAQLATNLEDLAAILLRSQHATVIIDRPSYKKLLPLIPGKTPLVLGESQNLICFRLI
jgi:4-amino-4-deoxy-L-arabinose transferase-like glycosyltransferase